MASIVSSNDRIRDYVSCPIYLILNRLSNDDPKNDESILKITPNYTVDPSNPSDSFYRIDWTEDRNLASKKAGKTQSFMMNREKLIRYLHSFLTLVKLDDHPYHSIDLMVPCMPSVSFGFPKFQEIRKVIMDAIEIFA